MGSPSYADALREKLEHAPVTPRPTHADLIKDAAREEKAIEPELVAAIMNLGRGAAIHPTRPSPGEDLPERYFRSSSGFLLCNVLFEVKVDQQNVQRESERLQKHAVVAYFVGGHQPTASLAPWMAAIQSQIGD